MNLIQAYSMHIIHDKVMNVQQLNKLSAFWRILSLHMKQFHQKGPFKHTSYFLLYLTTLLSNSINHTTLLVHEY